MGYLDEDGYLFLNGRNAETIISGGVNIYPQEIDSELLKHPAVDRRVHGRRAERRMGRGGEKRRSARSRAGSAATRTGAELIAFARSRFPAFKAPRSIDFVGELPRLPAARFSDVSCAPVLGRPRAADLRVSVAPSRRARVR